MLSLFLQDRDVPCPRCGYNLRDLQGERCPECGELLCLKVGSVELRLGAYLTALVAAAFGLGASVLLGAIAAFYAPLSWWGHAAGICLLTLVAFSLPVAAFLSFGGRRFRRAPHGKQRTIAWFVTAIVLALGICTGVFFRA